MMLPKNEATTTLEKKQGLLQLDDRHIALTVGGKNNWCGDDRTCADVDVHLLSMEISSMTY